MHCNNCELRIEEEIIRWAFEDPYCEECFDNLFNYCSRCDSVIQRDGTSYNDEGDPFCSECYEQNFDDESPNNPPVTETDRNLIVRLSRSWLQGKLETRRPVFINEKDLHLKSIKDKVGLVDCPIYVFGLRDREEYEIMASNDLLELVQEYLTETHLDIKVSTTQGCNRLGISLSLRQNHQIQIIELIRSITNIQETVQVQ